MLHSTCQSFCGKVQASSCCCLPIPCWPLSQSRAFRQALPFTWPLPTTPPYAWCRRQRCNYMRLRVVRRGDPQLEPAFFAALVEDRTPSGGMSYVEFLCYLHRQIQNKLS